MASLLLCSCHITDDITTTTSIILLLIHFGSLQNCCLNLCYISTADHFALLYIVIAPVLTVPTLIRVVVIIFGLFILELKKTQNYMSLSLNSCFYLQFGGIRTQCINIKAGMEIPDNKSLEYALPYIHGIGRSRARHILSELHMHNKLAKDLTKREIVALGDELSKYVIGRELV